MSVQTDMLKVVAGGQPLTRKRESLWADGAAVAAQPGGGDGR
jgi:hypothetical protein